MNTALALYLLFFFLLLVGLFKLIGFRVGPLFERVYEKAVSKKDLVSECKSARGKKQSFIKKELLRMRNSLRVIGSENKFKTCCLVSILLSFTGITVSVLFGNFLLAPILAVVFAALPFLVLGKIVSDYNKKVKNELETTLSVITNSYIRTEDIVTAVKENIPYIKRPLKRVFTDFLRDATVISPDLDMAMINLKNSIDSNIFREWCDAVRACLDDRTLKDTLRGIVLKLTETRLINNELQTIVSEPRKEFISMVLIIIANVPLLRLLNKSWFDALVNTVQGKITLAVSGAIIILATFLMFKFTKPIEYGDNGERL